MEPAELAILKTVLYSDLFSYPLRFDELRRGLFDVEIDADELRRVLDRPYALADALGEREGFVFLAGRDHLVDERRAGERNARSLRRRYARVLGLIARLPFVRLVAISGAVAFDNAHDDDVDVFVVAAGDRVWSACMCVTVLTRLLGARRAICANYFLDEHSLAIADRDLYTAHQLVHLEPFAGAEMFRALVTANSWAAELLPGAFAHAIDRHARPLHAGMLRRAVEWLAGAALEPLSRRVLGANLKKKVPTDVDAESVRLGPDRLKLHINDHRADTLARFERALAACVARCEEQATGLSRRARVS